MALQLNPVRLYSGRLCLNHGLLVDILRMTNKFWKAYQELLELNRKKKSDYDELHDIMEKMEKVPRKKVKITEPRIIKIRDRVVNDFDSAFLDLKVMTRSLSRIIEDDETFLFRTVQQLAHIYDNFRKLKNPAVPENFNRFCLETQHNIYSLLKHLEHLQHHAWVVSKAHARDKIVVSELVISSNYRQKNKIRRETIELDHLRNKITPLSAHMETLKWVKNEEDVKELHAEVTELLELYHEEVEDLSSMLHEADVLIRRSEYMIKAIEEEAHNLNLEKIVTRANKFSIKLRKLLRKIENQARREASDISILVNKLPTPKALYLKREEIEKLAEKKKEVREKKEKRKTARKKAEKKEKKKPAKKKPTEKRKK
ncbi:hypothetical protein HQ545_00565 [Candidatus Woesearchaeota archaeon]|nr:hypothetical protein [Candidatus Woesearchaeota archaeon]